MKGEKFLDALAKIYLEKGAKLPGYKSNELLKGTWAGTGGVMNKRLSIIYMNLGLKVSFIAEEELHLEINSKPPFFLFIKPESKMVKLGKILHVVSEVEVFDDKFNEKYLIQDIPRELAEKIINPEFIQIFTKLEPIIEFKMNNLEYQLIKNVPKEYSPEDAVNDFENLITLRETILKYYPGDK